MREEGLEVMWIASAESQSMRGASHQPIFMGDCLNICHMYLPCLPSEWISFCVAGDIEVSADAACGRELSLAYGICCYQKSMLLWVMVRW